MITYKAEIKSCFRGEELATKRTEIIKEEVKNEFPYVEGYLKKGAFWSDSEGNVYRNQKEVKVEIWNRQIVKGDGGKLTQIFFLEGYFAGVWGYTVEEFLLRDE